MGESAEDTVTVEWGHRYVSPWGGGVESLTLPAKDEATAERDVADFAEAYGRAPNFIPAWVVCRTVTVTPWAPRQ